MVTACYQWAYTWTLEEKTDENEPEGPVAQLVARVLEL